MFNKLKSLGFTLGHIQLIIAAFLLIAGVLYFQIFISSGKDEDSTAPNATQDVGKRSEYAKAVSEYSQQLNGDSNQTPMPSEINGNVLGSTTKNSTGNSEFQPRGAPKSQN